MTISIHALLAESDAKKVKLNRTTSNFYPRSPCGERHVHLTVAAHFGRNFYPRSPCGERLVTVGLLMFNLYFYPRSPCGERRQVKQTCRAKISISIHALLAESDARRASRQQPAGISIHALLAESDRQNQHQRKRKGISIHALLAESDAANTPKTKNKISIHALLAESDWLLFQYHAPLRERPTKTEHPFLSTLSLRRATILDSRNRHNVTIHALLAESDVGIPEEVANYEIFIHALLAESDQVFYPRSPLAESDSKSAQNSGALLRIWNKFYGDCIFMLTGKAVFYPFCPCFFHIFWCEGTENFMIAFPSH